MTIKNNPIKKWLINYSTVQWMIDTFLFNDIFLLYILFFDILSINFKQYFLL